MSMISMIVSRNRPPSARRRIAGFTLIELMVVLVILGLLGGLVGPRLFGNVDTSKIKTADAQIKMIRSALHAYRLEVGNYPTTAEGLSVLNTPPQQASTLWNGPYLEDDLPLDPWQTPYRYESPAKNNQGFVLYSLGADKNVGGEGIDADIGYLPQN